MYSSWTDAFVFTLLLAVLFFVVNGQFLSKRVTLPTQQPARVIQSIMFFVIALGGLLLHNSSQDDINRKNVMTVVQNAAYATLLFFVVSGDEFRQLVSKSGAAEKLTEVGVNNSNVMLTIVFFVAQFLLTV